MPTRASVRVLQGLVSMALTCGQSTALADPSLRATSTTEVVEPPASWLRGLPLSIQKLTLENGLRVVLHVTPGARTAAVAVGHESKAEPLRLGRTQVNLRRRRNVSRPFEPRRPLDWVQSPEQRLLAERGGYIAFAQSAGTSVSLTVVPEDELEFALWFAGRAERRPSRAAALAIVGDFEADTIVPWVEAHFGARVASSVPGSREPAPASSTFQSEPTAHLEPPGAARCDAWDIAETGTPDHYALKLAARLLKQANHLETALLNRGVAIAVAAGTADRPGKDIWKLCTRSVGITSPALARATPLAHSVVLAHLRRLATVAPSAAELDMVKRQAEHDLVRSLAASGERAALLVKFELAYGDARRVSTEVEHYAAQTPETVRSAIARFLLRAPSDSSSSALADRGAP